ncbi:lamin tail domain-containing protein [Haloferula chungangensis]|uniref:Lamin tail domain-containing protein n=1 Tax=Haloferula chungangensis TaxID=1048331 RepID=A0ABW2L5U5_9BACT
MLPILLLGGAAAVPIDLSDGSAAQSTTLSTYDASLAIDGIPNFTHTVPEDPDPTWQIALPVYETFTEITIVNRGGTGSWLPRFRDLTVQVVDFSGDVDSDFNGGTVVYQSDVLNPGNILGSPASITVNVGEATGNMIRVIRKPDGQDQGVLSLDEVTAVGLERILSFASTTPLIAPGDPIVLDWAVAPTVTGISINHGIGDVMSITSDGVGSYSNGTGPSETTTYELTATSSGGSTKVSTTIAVTDQPLIYSFAADQLFVSSGSTVNLNWNAAGNVESLALNGDRVVGTTGTSVQVTSDTVFELVAGNGEGTVSRKVGVKVIEPGVPVISEFLASNSDGLTDADGNSSDWIELYNPGSVPAPLLGYYLTDDESEPTKWAFPDVTMAPGSHLIIFASGDNRVDPSGELHANFSLSVDGEYLALVKPDAITIASEYHPGFPAQRTDVSYGIDGVTNVDGYFLSPTPGAPNGSSVLGFVRDTAFSLDRGFYTDPIEVEISSPTPGAEIRYTLDGSKPTATSGHIYTPGSPVTISQTSVLRAAAFLDQYEPTNVDTHTYIFKADVISGANMDTDITQDPDYGPKMDQALSAIPSISLNFSGDLDYDEKEVSIELINFESGDKQADAGMERFGGYVTNFDKRSARITFRKEYGPGKLDFDLFENYDWASYQPAKEYDAIELRAGNHDMWQRGAYLSNRYADDALLDMGQIAPHGRFVHLYMNGEYWGQYHLRERWNASMLSEYFGGEKEDYEAVNANNAGRQFQTGVVYDGTGEQWMETQSLVNGETPFASARSHLDINNLIDFMLLWTSGDSESEFRAAGSVPLGVPFKFFLKDADGFLRTPSNSHHNVDHNGPLSAMTALANEGHPDYRMLLADRIHMHYFNDGALTSEKNIERLQKRVEETQLSIIPESARWGYMDPSLTPGRWASYQQNLINNHFPSLEATMISRFEEAGMYPSTDAPIYSSHGGSVQAGGGPTISVTDPSYKVYYLFGAGDSDPDPYRHSLDPRLPGGGVNPAASMIEFSGSSGSSVPIVQSGDNWSYLDNGTNQGVAWRAASFVEDGSWKNGPSELGYGDDDEAEVVGYVDADAVTPGMQKNATTYFRKSDIYISNPSQFANFSLNYVFDDGIAIYVNGVEVERRNLAANADFDQYTGSGSADDEEGSKMLDSSLFVEGNNTIAVEIHNKDGNSSDISFNLELSGNLPGSGLNSSPIAVTESGWLLSRSYNTANGEWSALNIAFFTPEPVLADSGNLVISEFNYHPEDPLTSAELAAATDADEFEFVEFKNVASVPVDLSGVSFTTGIEFTFAANNILPAGGRMVIVKNMAAFEARYAGQLGSILFGTDALGGSEYGGKLSNSGEQLVLEDAEGGIIHDFSFSDEAPWPTASDGPGFSLVLINPEMPIPDHNLARSWAASARIGGYPGAPGAVGFVGDPLVDQDGDGLKAIVEYALGSSDSVAGDSTVSSGREFHEVNGVTSEYLTIRFLRNQHAANAVRIDPQIGEDLTSWSGEPELVLVSETDMLDGTTRVVYRSAVPIGERSSGREFIQIKVEQ